MHVHIIQLYAMKETPPDIKIIWNSASQLYLQRLTKSTKIFSETHSKSQRVQLVSLVV